MSASSTISAKRVPGRAVTQPLLMLARLTRVDRAVIAGLYAVLGGYIAGAPLATESVLRSAFMILCIVCFANVINDHADAAVDALSKPYRPIPSGACSIHGAKVVAVFLAFVALIVASSVSVTLVVMACVMLALSGAYSWWFKGTLLIGNGVIALLVGSTVICGAIAWGQLTTPVLTASVLIALYVLGQEVLFNLEDEAGDRASGVQTTAARLTAERTLVLYRGLLVTFMFVAFVPALREVASTAYLIGTIVCVAIPALLQLALLAGTRHSSKIARAARLSRIMWITGIVPLVLLRP